MKTSKHYCDKVAKAINEINGGNINVYRITDAKVRRVCLKYQLDCDYIKSVGSFNGGCRSLGVKKIKLINK